jgi:uncharacterized membrane protein YkvI
VLRRGWLLSATLVGAVVGAGFATGREILQFFALHGPVGYVGMLLAAGLIVWFCGVMVGLQSRHRFNTYRCLYTTLAGQQLDLVLDWVTTGLFFLALSVTLSALAALLEQEWTLSAPTALALAGVVCILITATGARGILRFNGAMVPLLLILLLGLCFLEWSLVPAPPGIRSVASNFGWLPPPALGLRPPEYPSTPYWPLSAFLYFSYNVLFIAATLVAVGSADGAESSQSVPRSGSADAEQPVHNWKPVHGHVAGLAIGFLGMAVLSIIVPQVPSLVDIPIPLAAVAAARGELPATAFSVALALALLTTAVAQAYSIASRFGRKADSTAAVSTAVVCLALPVASLGFVKLLATVYPLMGLAGAVLVLAVLWRRE